MKSLENPQISNPILLIDDDDLFVEYMKTLLEGFGYTHTDIAFTGKEGLGKAEQREYSLVLLDLMLPDISGLSILEILHKKDPDLPIVVITAKDKVETAVECMKLGAFDFLTKPLQEARLLPILQHALTIRTLRETVSSLQSGGMLWQLRNPEAFREIITQSELMREVFSYVEAIAPSGKAVLITGESGTGKELIARTLHKLSGRKGRFISVNIAGLDDTLFSDTLFGHVKGAYTGANTDRNGLVQEAAHGTLFLDEIGDMEPSSQVKLLRLLQEGEYYRLGSDTPLQSTARILAATNTDLHTKVREGKFRADLYYRLVAHRIELPPLRDRKEDIPLLAEAFIERAAQELQKPKPSLPEEVLAILSTYSFPGNIRELQSLLYDAVSRTEGTTISKKPILSYLQNQSRSTAGTPEQKSLKPADSSTPVPFLFSSLSTDRRIPTLKEVEEALVRQALNLTGGNQSAAAKLLGISQSTLSRWIHRLAK
ncbi:MAG: sigma-54 dependent transcriptional regulator [Spirochaetes bacterium]|nr:sigma-54 dependent transcriptional regulator [Spirochaetota bacterium]